MLEKQVKKGGTKKIKPFLRRKGFRSCYVMASQERFELPTHALEGRCSIQLSYWDMERVMRIELTTSAWKAEVLPLNYTRI
jgi:hypothetical protein